jgi:ABC-type amino acid transport substrate-binding protein
VSFLLFILVAISLTILQRATLSTRVVIEGFCREDIYKLQLIYYNKVVTWVKKEIKIEEEIMNCKKIISLLLGLIFVTSMIAGCSNKEGYVVAVATGTTYQEEAEKFSNVETVRTLRDDNLTLSELANDRVDAVISDRLLALYAIKESGLEGLALAGDVIYNETIAVGIRQEDKALRQAINEALAAMIEDGTYEAISQKYFQANILDGFDYIITYPDEEVATDNSLQRVLDAGEITFAMSGGYPPFNYFDANDNLTGFDVEIGQEVARKLGVEYVPVTTDWSGIVEGLRSGRYDGIFGSMGITEERLEVISFTNPYYFSGAQIIVKEGSPIQGPADLGEQQ